VSDSENLPYPKRHVTQADVARLAGVSRSVVSYVINEGPRSVSGETRRRVLQAIETLSYRPNKHAQMLIHEKWDTVAHKQLGVVISELNMFQRPFYGAILAGLHEEAQARGWHVRFVRVFEVFKSPVLFNQLVHRQEVAGLVLLALDQVVHGPAEQALLERMIARINNVVCLEWQHPGLPSVNFDRQQTAFGATQHLLALGHHKIAYIGFSDERVAGYRAALLEVGGTPRPYAAHDARSGLAQLELLLHEHPHITGVVAGSDEIAFGILRGLHLKRRRVPDEVALVSIDNIALAEFVTPALTTVAVPQAELGQHAIKMLVQRESVSMTMGTDLRLPTKLIIRESCGATR